MIFNKDLITTSAMARVRNWMFTINNFSDELEPLDWIPEDSACVWQSEIGKEGTPHLQGYLELDSQQRLSYLKKLHPTAHWESRRGTQAQAIDYCTKSDETYVEGPWCYGDFKEQGARNDLAALRQMMVDGSDIKEVKDANFDLYCRAKHALDSEYNLIRNERAKQSRLSSYDSVEWRPWQAEVIELIKTDPDPRKVHWYYEQTGNAGKSYLANYLICKYDAFLCTGGKVQDIQYAYQGERIIILDLSRTKAEQMDHLYEMIERWKDGSFLSTKYESQMKHFAVPHILAFSNFKPDLTKLSLDRWDVNKICGDFVVNEPAVPMYTYERGFANPEMPSIINNVYVPYNK